MLDIGLLILILYSDTYNTMQDFGDKIWRSGLTLPQNYSKHYIYIYKDLYGCADLKL